MVNKKNFLPFLFCLSTFVNVVTLNASNLNTADTTMQNTTQKNINKKTKQKIPFYKGNIKITKRRIYFNKLIIDNANIRYPYYWLPVYFKVKSLTLNGNGNIRLYGWKLLEINKINGNCPKFKVDSTGVILIKNIQMPNLNEIVVGKYAPLVYLEFNQSKPIDINLIIATNKDRRIVVENDGKATLKVKCKGKYKNPIFYKGNSNNISVEGSCKLYLIKPTIKNGNFSQLGKKFEGELNFVNSNSIKYIIDKSAWVDEKNIIYFLKYKKDGDKIVGVIFGVDLKSNKIIKVPNVIAKATGYEYKINKNGHTYYFYKKIPESSYVIYNHKRYMINVIK